MASAIPSLPAAGMALSKPPSFWQRDSAAIKHGLKTGIAGLITYVIYLIWHLPEGYWVVITALVVAQVTLGASWKPALYRTVGSASGAIAAMLLITILGSGTVRVGIALFVLATLFGFLTMLHPSFSAAGFTVAIVLVIGPLEGSPIKLGWLRVLYTILGSFVAFAVGALIWPVRAREGLRRMIANIIEGSGILYRALTDAALQGVDNQEKIRALDKTLHDLRRGITQQMDEARHQLAFSRFNNHAYQQLVERADLVRRRLAAMAEDRSLYVHAQVEPGLLPSLPVLAERTSQMFAQVAAAVRTQGTQLNSTDLDAAIQHLDADLAALRNQRATVPYTLDRMLPFWALVFNLREVTQDLKQLELTVAGLA